MLTKSSLRLCCRNSNLIRRCKKSIVSSSFVTSPIFYVNAAPHIGHLYSALLADATHRFHRLKFPEDTSALFSTGTDEHGTKVEEAAKSQGVDCRQYCDSISCTYRKLFDSYGLDYTRFIRTTEESHAQSVRAFWNLLESKGFIYEGTYAGWYCVSDEMYLSENQIVTSLDKAGNEIKLSELSGHPVEWHEEENFLFRLSKLKDDLMYWLRDEKVVQPCKFYKILRSWIDDERIMKDISISRPSHRVSWGIRTPKDDDQTVYVWLDALVNYLTVAGFPRLERWPPTTQIIGKDILKFHGIFWPAFLAAAGLELPRKLFVHSHWTVNDEKMSKSKNNVVDPFAKMETYTASGFRYFLLKEGVPHNNGNYNETKVVNMLNADLANTLGNLLTRCTGKNVNREQTYPKLCSEEFNLLNREYDSLKNLDEKLANLKAIVNEHYESLHFYVGIQEIVSTLHDCNRFFEDCKPWELCKEMGKATRLNCILHITMETLRICGIALSPVVPEISEKLFQKLNVPNTRTCWSAMEPSWRGVIDRETVSLAEEKVILYKKLFK